MVSENHYNYEFDLKVRNDSVHSVSIQLANFIIMLQKMSKQVITSFKYSTLYPLNDNASKVILPTIVDTQLRQKMIGS